MLTLRSVFRLFVFVSIIFISFCFTQNAEAKVFRNSYVSFELPSKWDCYLENTAWICRYAISKKCLGAGAKTKSCKAQRKKTKEAIIILAAKEKGPKDTFKGYYTHLKTPRPIVTKAGKRSQSKIVHVKPISIEKQRWLDGMHEGSEIPHYYTRYLATIKGNIAVLVTFSAHKLFYTKYSNEFFRAIKSLRVLATRAQTGRKDIRPKNNSGTFGPGDINVGDIDLLGEEGEYGDGKKQSTGLDFYLLIGAGILALLGLVIWFKGRR